MSTDNRYGRADLMAIAAVRYCIGRSTYIVGDCVDWLIHQWHNIDERAQETIRHDIAKAIKHDDEDRSNGKEHTRLGHDCDRAEWDRFMKFYSEWNKGGEA